MVAPVVPNSQPLVSSDGTTQDQLPAQGAPPSAPQAPGILQGSGLEQMVAGYLSHLVANQPSPTADVQQRRAAQAAAAAPVVEKPTPAPGSFADKLQTATDGGGGTGPGSELLGGLADAAHASDTKGGWLSGVANTLNARQNRIAQQRKDDALLAKTQAETLAMHRNMYMQDQAMQQAFQAANQKYVDQMKEAHDIEENVTWSDLQNRMKTDPEFAKKYWVRETGSEPDSDVTGAQRKDKNGNPAISPMYTLVNQATKDGQPDTKKVTADMSADMKRLGIADMPEGTHLTATQLTALDTAVTSTMNAKVMLENTNHEKLSDDQLKTLKPYLTDPTIQAALAHYPGNGYGGLKQYMDNANDHIQQLQQQMADAKANGNQAVYDSANERLGMFQAEKAKVSDFVAKAIDPKQIAEYNKAQGDASDELKDLQKKANAAHGEEASGMAAGIQNMLDNKENNYSPQQVKTLTGIRDQLKASAQASQDWETQKKKNEQEASNAINEDDVPTLINHAFAYDVDPDKLFSMRKNTKANFMAQMFNEADKRGIKWSEADYRQRYDMRRDLAKDTLTSMGGQVDSLNRFGMHTGRANDSIEGLRNIGSPVVNTAINKVKEGAVGFPEAQQIKLEMEAVKDEFFNLVKNGHVPMSTEEERVASMLNTSRTPAELQETFRSMAKLVADRAQSINGRYQTVMGTKDSIPGLLQADTAGVLSKFGVNVNNILTPNEQHPDRFQKVGSTGQTRPAGPNAPAGAVEDPNRPKGFNDVRFGSDHKAYYYNSQTHAVQAVPDQYQKLYKEE